MRRIVESCQGRGNNERGDPGAVPRSMSGATVWRWGCASCAHLCTSACNPCADLRPSSPLRQTLRPVSANLRVRSRPGPLCSDERHQPPMCRRPAGVSCPVRQDHVTLGLASPSAPAAVFVFFRVGVRQARCTGCALTKAQSLLRLDKARVYLARHQLIEHPVPVRMHLRGKLSQMRGFIVRAKTKSRSGQPVSSLNIQSLQAPSRSAEWCRSRCAGKLSDLGGRCRYPYCDLSERSFA
jgi:hypothetical protein